MKFEIIYFQSVLKYLLKNIGEVCHNEHVYGTWNMCNFVIDLLFIFKYENFSGKRQRKELRKLCRKVKETNYNLTARQILERYDNIYM